MTCFLSLDLATKCGWAVCHDGVWHSGVWNMTKSTSKKKGETEFTRLAKLRQNLTDLHEKFPIEFVSWEAVNFARFTQAHAVWNQLFGVLQLFAIDNGYGPGMSIGTTALKKYATGSGKAEKCEMVAAASSNFEGWEPKDDNEADARLVGLWTLEQVEKKLRPSSK